MNYQIILAPKGASIPDDIGFPVVTDGDIIERIAACRDQETIITASPRELQFMVEYRDLLVSSKLRAIIGLKGAVYNTVWNMYVSTMERTTVDALTAESHAQNDEQSRDGQRQERSPETRERDFSLRSDNENDDVLDDTSDDVDGDIE
jgi:hypothetical protein